ncbi:hypothetical protein H6P81_008075 [Aristolochia fimbriata]|uniref:PLAC8 motif-containing protein n=1 Tax=Aristolochia fimbriata TaxID=158543 RepID=A0AAV7F4V5_ARIFI|nr:hypothetical protein H6P81_008075 [Aristolochia fimbriata]
MNKAMFLNEKAKSLDEIQEETGCALPTNGVPANGLNSKSRLPLHVSVSQRGLLSETKSTKGFLKGFFSKGGGFGKFNSTSFIHSPSAKFLRFAEEKDEVSRQVPSPTAQGFRELLKASVRKIEWESLQDMCKKWFRDPMNIALFIWITCVAVSGAILFLVMTGMLNHSLPRKAQRDVWFEVNNQILNALFTLMCLYQHPKRFHHLVLLIRWRPDDVLKLRKSYCKNGTYKPHEWIHMMVVVTLLHINCFAQYALCGLNLGYRRSERPAVGVGICVAVAISAPAIAGVYSMLSPLGKEYSLEPDQEAQDQASTAALRRKSFEKRYSFVSRDEHRLLETQPQWRGGLFDLWDDISVAYLSLFCGFCVFGWNMERLGFGNMYVHIATFLLFCMAPFWIFNLAAVNIDNEVVREALGFTGIVLCVFGLLYGGFWRIQMRKRFKLPANNFCFGYPAVTDCAQWLCCCMCSLAQEVRTVDFYEIKEDKLYRKDMIDVTNPPISPLPREAGSPLSASRLSSTGSPLSTTRFCSTGSPLSTSHLSSPLRSNLSPRYVVGNSQSPGRLGLVQEEFSLRDEVMLPPSPSSIQRDDKPH